MLGTAEGAGRPEGGCVGMLLSWLASFPADRVARSPAERQVHTRLTESLFVFPP
jgi:hypothetical protein